MPQYVVFAHDGNDDALFGRYRRELIKRGSVLGMSLPFLGMLAGGAQVPRELRAPGRDQSDPHHSGVGPA